jgi:hypothetical protein
VFDPLNDNVVSPKIFELYEKKRIDRLVRYDKVRDTSFDFMNIGDDLVQIEFDEGE